MSELNRKEKNMHNRVKSILAGRGGRSVGLGPRGGAGWFMVA